MKFRPTFVVAPALLVMGHLSSHPPLSGLGLVLLPMLAWMQRRDELASPWYVFLFFLGVGIKIPFAIVDVGSCWALALTTWLGYALVAALLSRPPRAVTNSCSVSSWVFVTLSLPLIGFVFVAPPLAAAGWFYPGAGLAGVLLIVWLGAAIVDSVSTARLLPLAAPLGLAALLNLVAVLAPPPRAPIASVSLNVPAPPHNLATSILAAVRLRPIVRDAFAGGAKTVILPENVLGAPTPGVVAILGIPDGRTLIAGGLGPVVAEGGNPKGTWVLPGRTFYPALQPIPFVEAGLKPHWQAIHKSAKIDGTDYSLLVCFEASTSIPLYHLHYGQPVLLIANGWWDRSGIMDIEASLAQSWGRLYRSEIEISRGKSELQKRPFFD